MNAFSQYFSAWKRQLYRLIPVILFVTAWQFVLRMSNETPNMALSIQGQLLSGLAHILETAAIALSTNIVFPHALVILRKFWPERFGDDI